VSFWALTTVVEVPWKFLILITVWMVVQTVFSATFNSYGNRQISAPYKINTPEPIEKKICTIDYVREETPIPTKCTHWGLLEKWVKYNKNYFYLFIPFFWCTRTGQTRGWIFTCDSKTWNHARMSFFGVIKCKFNFKPLFIPQNRQILAQNGTSFLATKSKLPLIIIVAP